MQTAPSQVYGKIQQISVKTSPAIVNYINTTPLFTQTSAGVDGSHLAQQSSSVNPHTNTAQRRPRLAQIKLELAKKKKASEVSSVGHGIKNNHDNRNIGNNVEEILRASGQFKSATNTQRPRLAAIKKHLREKAELTECHSSHTLKQPNSSLHSQLSDGKNVSAYSSSNEKNNNILDNEQQRLPNEASPYVPEQTKTTIQVSPSFPGDTAARHHTYVNLAMMQHRSPSLTSTLQTCPLDQISATCEECRPRRNKYDAVSAGERNKSKTPSKSKAEGKGTQQEFTTTPVKDRERVFILEDKNGQLHYNARSCSREARKVETNHPLPIVPGISYHPAEPKTPRKINNYENIRKATNHSHLTTPAASHCACRPHCSHTHQKYPTHPYAQDSSKGTGMSRSLDRKVKFSLPLLEMSHDNKGYMTCDLSPPERSLISHRLPPPSPSNIAPNNSRTYKEVTGDSDYINLHLTGVFDTPSALQAATTKVECSKKMAYCANYQPEQDIDDYEKEEEEVEESNSYMVLVGDSGEEKKE